MSKVVLENITKVFGDKTVLRELDLSIGESELVALLGPSGCGKSTTLRILAGLEQPENGRVLVNGKDQKTLPVRKRNMGIVFQAYSLFPHLTALENVAYGLKIRGVGARSRKEKAGQLLELVGLSAHAEKFPAQMSGGQQQRVALARALAIEPSVLLLDEPLSALDAKVRTQLREEIRRIQLSKGISTLLVTHDQEEAWVMADRVGVMNSGEIEQIGSPRDLYLNPKTPFISQFVGVTNRVPCEVVDGGIEVLGKFLTAVNFDENWPKGIRGNALIRPEDFELSTGHGGAFRVLNKQLRGLFTAVSVAHESLQSPIRIDIATRTADSVETGEFVDLSIIRNDVVVDIDSKGATCVN